MARKANLPLHTDKSRAWDGPAARSRMVKAATDSEGNINSSVASEGFVYMLNDGSVQSDYKSPFADIIDGRKKVVWNGLSAAKARNNQVQGISSEERASGLAFIESQQDRFPSDDEAEEKIVSSIRPSLTFQLEEPVRENDRILIHSGKRTRNRDWWTGKPYRIIPDGMRLDYFLKNPLVLWMHDFNIPLAKSDLFIDDGMLWATDNLKFHRRTIPIVEVSGGFFGGGAAVGEFDTSVIADMWNERFYNAVSVHVIFRPEDELNIIEEEEEIVAETSEVLEWSIVTFPGDPESGRDDRAEEMIDRMVHRGMRRDVAEAITRGPKAFSVAGQALFIPKHLLKTANSGSSVSVSVPRRSETMDPKEKVEETQETFAAEAENEDFQAAEYSQVEPVGEMTQEIQIPASELAKALVEDEEAIHILAMALINHPGFAEAVAETWAQSVEPTTEFVSQPVPPITIKFVSNGKEKRQPQRQPVRQQGGMITRPQLSNTRPSVAQAQPVAVPGQNRVKKSPIMKMVRRT